MSQVRQRDSEGGRESINTIAMLIRDVDSGKKNPCPMQDKKDSGMHMIGKVGTSVLWSAITHVTNQERGR